MIDRGTSPSASAWRAVVTTIALVGVATAVGAVARGHLAAPDLVMLYVLVIGLSAALFGRRPSLLAAALSVFAYNFFFVPPFYTLHVENDHHILTFVTMFVVGLFISGLMARIRMQEREATARERRTAALYALSRDLGGANNTDEALKTAARRAVDDFAESAAVLIPNQKTLRVVASAGASVELDEADVGAARWSFDRRRVAGYGTGVCADAHVTCVPLDAGVDTLGVVAFRPRLQTPITAADCEFLEAFARQAAFAIARARFADTARAAILRAHTEEMRSSLLSAVSHDLRTPLAAITGAATTLRSRDVTLNETQRDDLVDTICEEAERLERLVRNLLDMTRIESGNVTVKREWVPIEEIVSGALGRMERELGSRAIRTDLPPALPLVAVDPVLLEQVFVNLIENACRYTPAGSPLEVVGILKDDAVIVEVADSGPGVGIGNEQCVFEKFFRGHTGQATGAGLGLAICKGIMQAHGGSITAENRPQGGAAFRVHVPVVGSAPEVPRE